MTIELENIAWGLTTGTSASEKFCFVAGK